MKTCAIISSILGLSYCLPAASLPDIVWQTDPQPNGVLDVIWEILLTAPRAATQGGSRPSRAAR